MGRSFFIQESVGRIFENRNTTNRAVTSFSTAAARLSIALFLPLLLSGLCASQTVTSFEGIDASTPGSDATLRVVDPNGAVGTSQYLEWIDTAYQAYNKTTGAPIYSS